MELTADSLEFDSEDVIAWNAFLRTRAGQRLIPKLLESSPQLLPGGGTNEILVRNGEVLGFTNAARTLLFLANPPPAPAQADTTYSDLTDDSKWQDGQKLTT